MTAYTCPNLDCILTAADAADVVLRYKAGRSTLQIARRYRCSIAHIRRTLNTEADRLAGTFHRRPGFTGAGLPDRRRWQP